MDWTVGYKCIKPKTTVKLTIDCMHPEECGLLVAIGSGLWSVNLGQWTKYPHFL